MRQGQQNRRGRGRGRKPQNPLARNYESNGPDVKIRGTAAHIAEKYMSLARDALASGDNVGAESYLQHAEHYNRIIMAAQAQQGTAPGGHAGDGMNGSDYRGRPGDDGDSGDDGDMNFGPDDGIRNAIARGDRPRGGRGRPDLSRANGSETLHDGSTPEPAESDQDEDSASDSLN
jgi:Domain of unknown function (DUF4167)